MTTRERRLTIGLAMCLVLLAGTIVLAFFSTGFMRWLSILVALCNVGVFWELRKSERQPLDK